MQKELSFDFFKSSKNIKKSKLIHAIDIMFFGLMGVAILGFVLLFGKSIQSEAIRNAVSPIISNMSLSQSENNLFNKSLNEFSLYIQQPETDKNTRFYYDSKKLKSYTTNLMSHKVDISSMIRFMYVLNNSPVPIEEKQKIAKQVIELIFKDKETLEKQLSKNILERGNINILSVKEYRDYYHKKIVKEYGQLWLISQNIIHNQSIQFSSQMNNFSDELKKFEDSEPSALDDFFRFFS